MQRLKLASLVGIQEGRASDMRVYLGILDKLSISNDEKIALGMVEQTTGAIGEHILRWDPQADTPKEFELEDAQYARLRQIVEAWPRFTAADSGWLQPILTQFGI